MPLPTYEEAMLPALSILSKEDSLAIREIVERVSKCFNLSDNDKLEMLPSGSTRTITSRVGWALTYMYQAGLVSRPKRGEYAITDRGNSLLSQNPSKVDVETLSQYEEFVAFRLRSVGKKDLLRKGKQAEMRSSGVSPLEALEEAAESLNVTLSDDILEAIKDMSPAFFETLILKLLVAMGYGNGLTVSSQHLGKSGDGGIDGLI